MSDFNSIVNGWAFAPLPELRNRIRAAEAHAGSHTLSPRQLRVLEEMKQAERSKATP
jgi:hypothetical protein